MHKKSLEAAETLNNSDNNESDEDDDKSKKSSRTADGSHLSFGKSFSPNSNPATTVPSAMHQSDSRVTSPVATSCLPGSNNNNDTSKLSPCISIEAPISPTRSSIISPQSIASSSTPPSPHSSFAKQQMSPPESASMLAQKEEYYHAPPLPIGAATKVPSSYYHPPADPEGFKWMDYRHPAVSYIR
jgi:hypothetical protein